MRKSVAIGVGLLVTGGTVWAQYLITTVAGGGLPPTASSALSVPLPAPSAITADRSGNLYFPAAHCVFKIDVTGVLTRVAGSTIAGYAGDGGPATSAQLDGPQGVALDGAGNLYIADTGNSRIRKVAAATGVISTVAGTAFHGGLFGDGGPATSAELNSPYGVAVDAAGNFYIADSGNNVIREVTAANGNIATVAGNGTYGYTGDGGPATSAELRLPAGVALDAAGNLYIAENGSNVIRKVTAANGDIATVGGNGNGSWGDGGPATGALLSNVDHEALDAAGNLYIADSGNNRIRKVAAATGIITTVAGNGTAGYAGDNGPATSAELNGPAGVAVDSAGNIYIADTSNNVVRKVAAGTGIITTVAGNQAAGAGYSGNGGPATSAQLGFPYGVAVDGSGNLYIADTWNAVIRRVTNGTIATVAGSNLFGYSGDGSTAIYAELNYPYGVAVDSFGTLYIADTGNSAIRQVASGIINTVAGNETAGAGYSGDGAAATSAQLQTPYGVTVDASSNIFIADTGNLVIREVTKSTGYISTVAGSRTYGYAGDGGLATNAQLVFPYDVAVNGSGEVFIGDQTVVRLLVPQGSGALLSAAETGPASLKEGQTGATYSVVVSNNSAAASTSGVVTVTDTVSAGLTLASMSGTGWSCSSNTCTRSDALNPGASYPAITVTVNVAAAAPSQVGNQVGVSGGGSPATSTSGVTTVIGGPPAAPVLVSPANGAAAVLLAPTLTWNASSGATSYDVYFGTLSTPPLVTNTTATSYSPGTLSLDATYYWQIVARNGSGSASSPTWSFTTGAALAPLRFVPVTPCRVADTRGPAGPFGGPTPAAGSTRSFTIPQSGCGIPATAQAYSLNVTVVPAGPLSYLTLWPAGQPQPLVSTLNSFGGTVVANAAIVPAGANGAVSVFVSNQTDVILDIDGYFASAGAAASYSFYPATPCRVADTRGPTGEFGGPSMFADQTRGFPIPSADCAIPATATAYSLNVTAVPDTDFLAYLSIWPTGTSQPLVSTLNSWTGEVVANAALVPAGTNGSISVYVTDPTDVILDSNGYFGQPGGTGALAFYPVAPCRVADTRNGAGPFGGPEMAAGETRSFTIPASGCYVPPTAAAYSLNVTVVPDGPLEYLSAWPAGSAQPFVSTLNSFDGAVVANAAIVPAGPDGAISVYVTNPTQVILDINGYFAP
jgi:uncharacterized repeat protein (TIGR01451 family)